MPAKVAALPTPRLAAARPIDKLTDLYIDGDIYALTGDNALRYYNGRRITSYALGTPPDEADVILLNSCSVREKAEQKFYSELGHLKRLKRQRPEMLIGGCGCIPQRARGEILERAPYVDLVFGTLNVSRVLDLVRQVEEEHQPVLEITDRVLDDDLGADRGVGVQP